VIQGAFVKKGEGVTTPTAYYRAHRFGDVIRQWLRPVSRQPEKAFRERAIRISCLITGIFALGLAVPVLLFLTGALPNPTNLIKPDHLRLVLFILAVSAVTAYLIHRQKLTLASGVYLIIPFFILFNTLLNNGYWSALAPFASIFALIMAVLLIPRRQFWWAVAAVAVFTLIGIGLREMGLGSARLLYPPATLPNNMGIMDNPISAAVLHVVFIVAVAIAINYYIAELERRQAALDTLVGQLESRVADRTRDLETARDEAQTLYQIGKAINHAQTYTEMIAVIARYMDRPEANVALSLYDNFDRAQAKFFTVIALRPAGKTETITTNMRFPASLINAWTDQEMFVVEDIDAPGALDPETACYYRERNSLSFLLTPLKLGDRIVGVLNVTWPTPHHFTDAERRFVLAVTDLIAATIERLRLFEEQVQATEQLRAVDKMKSQFLASMSHELRTPLNAILNFTEFVALGMMGAVNNQQTDALNKALSSGRHLLALINDVLDMTKIEAGMMRLFVEDNIDLSAELKQVVSSAQALLQAKPVRLVLDFDQNLPPFLGDRRRMRQILLNLLSNAAKFTETGTITFSAKRRDQGAAVLFAVIDTGPGIAKADQALIFEPFRQAEHGRQYGSGTGLGLPISRRLAEAHGGKLWVESDEGEGAAFYVLIPTRHPDLLPMLEA
jgi:signal transduction histidine kinase